MSKLDELQKQESELEKAIIEYKEVDDKRTVNRLEKQLIRTRNLIKIEYENKDIQIVKKLEIYEKFIKYQDLTKKFDEFYAKEIKEEE